jgi:hypothetical protein
VEEAKEVLAKLGTGDSEFEKLLGKFIKAGREHIAFKETHGIAELARAWRGLTAGTAIASRKGINREGMPAAASMIAKVFFLV